MHVRQVGLQRPLASRRPSILLKQGRRAISVPLTPVKTGLSRSVADIPHCRSGCMTGPDGTDSQADSAGSIPVTRSTLKAQVRTIVPEPGPCCFTAVAAFRAITCNKAAPLGRRQRRALP
jgi:hypothetical protein